VRRERGKITYTPFGRLALDNIEVYTGKFRPEGESIPEIGIDGYR